MRIVFVALAQEQLGLSALSGVLRRAGHETALVFSPALFNDRYYFDVPVLRDLFNRDDLLPDEIALAEPDLIAFANAYTVFFMVSVGRILLLSPAVKQDAKSPPRRT